MGYLSRLIAVVALLVQAAVGIIGLVVIGSADVVGEVAFLSKNDALLLLFLLVGSLVTTVVLAIERWRTSRKRRRLEGQLTAALHQPAAPAS
jgi:hypothetical protein